MKFGVATVGSVSFWFSCFALLIWLTTGTDGGDL